MFQIIRQFTFHRPKEIIQPTVWLFLSQACSMLPAFLAYMAIYTLGQAFVPPYTLDLQFLITLAAIGLGYILLQYAIELVSYYFTYGRAYSDTAKKRVAYIQKLRRQPLGFFSSKSSTDFLIIFSNLRKCWKGLLYQAFPAFCVSEDTPHIMAFRSLTWR